MIRLVLPLLLLASAALAQAPPSAASRHIDLVDDAMPVSRALEEIRRVTGIRIHDARGATDRAIPLKLHKASFWQAVDAVAAATAARVSQSSRDGAISLVARSAEDRLPPTSYDGDFRVRALRLSASRDLDSDRRGATLTLDITWTPTLRPLFLDTQVQGLRLLDSKDRPVPGTEEGSSLAPVDGRYSLTLDIPLPALPRTETHIGLIEGKVLAVAPTHFLNFRFDADLATLAGALADGAQRRLVVEDVTCRVDRVVLARDRWSVRVALDYPPGNRPLESFQAGSMVALNELTLVRRDGKGTLRPTASVIDIVSSRRAVVTYHFVESHRAPPGRAEDWRPHYTAPARIVDLPFRFRFTRLPLP